MPPRTPPFSKNLCDRRTQTLIPHLAAGLKRHSLRSRGRTCAPLYDSRPVYSLSLEGSKLIRLNSSRGSMTRRGSGNGLTGIERPPPDVQASEVRHDDAQAWQ